MVVRNDFSHPDIRGVVYALIPNNLAVSTPPPVTSISVSPSPVTVTVGSTQLFTATDQGGNPISVDWTLTGDTSVGTLSTSTGTSTTFTALKAGAATVRAAKDGVVGSAEVKVKPTVIWVNEDDGMVLPYDKVDLKFVFSNNLPTTLHNVKLTFSSKKPGLIWFESGKEVLNLGDISQGSELSAINSIFIAGVENNDIMTKIIDINGPGKIPLTDSIDVILQYDSSSDEFILTPSDNSGKTLEIQYPNFKTKVGDPIPKDDIGDYYMNGDTDFSNTADILVRKYAVEAAATDPETHVFSVFPDNPADVTYNVFRYVDDNLEGETDKLASSTLYNNGENDLWIVGTLSENKLKDYSHWLCIAHAYHFI